MTQSRIALPGFVVVDPDGHGFAASHDDHQVFATCDGGIYQVALKQDIVLGDDGDEAEHYEAYLTPEGFEIAQS